MPEAAPTRHPPLDAKSVLNWYDRNARALPWRVPPADTRRGLRPDPYKVWLSEIMLQQTTVAAVAGYFARFTTRWPDVNALAAAPREDVLAEWAGLGYYARARNLHGCAQIVANERSGRFPETSAELQTLPGIGPYTASAIAAICHDERIAVIDGNVERVLARYLALEVPVREAKPDIRTAVQQAVPERAGDFAQALMDLGATICAPRTVLCEQCPLRSGCAAARSDNPIAFPVKPAKTRRPTRFGHAYVVTRSDGAVWLGRRESHGMLGGMTEIPGSDWTDTVSSPDYPFSANWRPAGQVGHTFTHFHLELTVWSAGADGDPPGEGWWQVKSGLPSAGLPTLFKKVLMEAGIEIRR